MMFWHRKSAVPSAREERDVWLAHLDLDGKAKSTIDGYRQITNLLLNRWPELTLPEFDDEQIAGVIEDANPPSRQSRRGAFANLFAWALRTKRIPRNPMIHVPMYKQSAQEPADCFKPDECKRLRSLPGPDGTLMAILLGSGIRKAEARHLTVSRVDFDNAELTIVSGAKGDSFGVIPLERRLAKRIAHYVQAEELGPDDYLWYCHPGGTLVRRHDRPLSDTAFANWWTRCVADAGVRYRNLHQTRHTYATEWRRRGLSIDDVSDLLRHADPRTTRRVYVHTNAIDIRPRMEALA
jgi:integrase